MSFAPRVFYRVCSRVLCSYRTNHVVSAAMLLVLLLVGIIFLFFSEFFNIKSAEKASMQKWRKLRSACFPAFPTGTVDELGHVTASPICIDYQMRSGDSTHL